MEHILKQEIADLEECKKLALDTFGRFKMPVKGCYFGLIYQGKRYCKDQDYDEFTAFRKGELQYCLEDLTLLEIPKGWLVQKDKSEYVVYKGSFWDGCTERGTPLYLAKELIRSAAQDLINIEKLNKNKLDEDMKILRTYSFYETKERERILRGKMKKYENGVDSSKKTTKNTRMRLELMAEQLRGLFDNDKLAIMSNVDLAHKLKSSKLGSCFEINTLEGKICVMRKEKLIPEKK